MYFAIIENKVDNIIKDIPHAILNNFTNNKEGEQKKRSYAFLMYAISQICDLDVLQTPFCITDDYNDAQIDAVYINEESDVLEIHFFQSKYFTKDDKIIGENDIRLTLDSVQKILNGKNPTKHISPKLENKIFEIKNAIKENGYFAAYVHFVSNGNTMELPNIIENYNDFEINLYGANELVKMSIAPERNNIECEIHTIGDITQNLISGISGYVATVSAKEFIKMYKKAGEKKILEKNIRYYKGLNAINKKIKETAESPVESQFFWFVNNGISLVCDSFAPPKGDANGNKILKLKNPMIINGGQTTVTLSNANIHENTRILLKIYDLSDDEIIAKITEGTNSQNPINFRDLKSNNPIQKIIQDYFKDNGILLEIKGGEFEKIKGNQKMEIVKNDFLIQSYVAIYKDNPAEARSKMLALRRYFDEIFNAKNKNIAPDFFRSYEIMKYVSNQNTGESFYAHAAFCICYTMGKIDNKILDSKKELDDDALNKCFDKTLVIIKNIIDSKQKELGEDYSHNYLFKSKEIKKLIDIQLNK